MSSKNNKNLAFRADVSPYRYEVNERSPFPTKNPKINPFAVKSLLESNCKRFRQSAIRENFNLKLETQLKKLIPITEATIPINTMKWKRSWNQFPSFMSEPCLSTRSMTCMHLKKLKVFSSLRRPETHFKHAQGHQRAGALTGSINICQSTIITVYEVEHQKIVTTKPGKDYLVFRSNHRVLNFKINPFVVKSLLESNCKRFRISAIRGNFNLKLETEMKNSFQQTMQLFSPTERNWKEAVFNFLHLCLNNFWAPGSRDVCISKKSSFVLVFAGQKHISLLGRATIDRLFNCVR